MIKISILLNDLNQIEINNNNRLFVWNKLLIFLIT